MKKYCSIEKKQKKEEKKLISDKGVVKFNNVKNNLQTKGMKKSSQKWLNRQINDPYAISAKIEGYLARSAYKIIEIQKKYRIINHKTKIIIDLGCSPGSWSQAILTNRETCNMNIIGVDLLPIKFQHKSLYFIQGDFEEIDIQKKIVKQIENINLKNDKADCIICDIALNNIGVSDIDRIRSERIIEVVMNFCEKHLSKNGNLVCKALKGADNSVFQEFKKIFEQSHRFKPKSSRKDSSEIFLIGISKK